MTATGISSSISSSICSRSVDGDVSANTFNDSQPSLTHRRCARHVGTPLSSLSVHQRTDGWITASLQHVCRTRQHACWPVGNARQVCVQVVIHQQYQMVKSLQEHR